MKLILALIASALATGCAIDPTQGVGNGQYLQVLNDQGRVVLEMDVRNAGHMSCQYTATMEVNHIGKGQCAHRPTDSPMPFYYIAHIQKREANGARPSSPYWIRTATSELCRANLANRAAQPNTVILEDGCN
jgi:hypothetical protein